jgi:hypothetical protein
MISKLGIGGFNATPRDTALAYGDPVKQILKDIEEIARKLNEVIDVVNRLEKPITEGQDFPR